MPRRWRRLAAVSLLGIAVAPVVAGQVGAAPDGPVDVAFDWPVGCAVHVDQQFYDTNTAIDVSYDVTLTAVTADGVIAEFGPATLGDVVIDGVDDTAALEDQLAAFLTNPTLAIERDGAPAEALGLSEWLAGFRTAGPSAEQYSDSRLRREVGYRAAVATWGTWVGLWADLAAAGDLRDGSVDDVDYIDEFGDHVSADVRVETTVGEATSTLQLTRDLTGDDLARLWRNDYEPATGTTVDYDPDLDQWRGTIVSARMHLETLQPVRAGYQVTADLGVGNGGELVVAYEWTFDWSNCADAVSLSDAVVTVDTGAAASTGAGMPPGFATVTVDELPPEARETLALVDAGGPFPYRQDGAVFENREGILPDQPDGFYHEYTVETPGSDDRGARRIVVGADGVIFYTDDHYDSFRVLVR